MLLLKKMQSRHEDTVRYFFKTDALEVDLNALIGSPITLAFTGQIFCANCQKKTNKSFGEGFCFSCFQNAPQASPCIIRPELCQAHLGLGRDPDYEQKHHNQPHVVYLALTDQLKVGITRSTQIPTRWIDQGAASCIILAETPNRYEAGMLEVALKQHYSDKTNWQNMLRNIPGPFCDLVTEKWELAESLPADLSAYWSENDHIFEFNYPVSAYPSKVQSLSFDKSPLIQGQLTGIRGQYLYLDHAFVFNVRKHTSYQIKWPLSSDAF
ncbi:MAG: hypothetical protein RLZZ301_1120 [Bacteroidota bacterium]|jgi:hypothetical protein